MSNRLPRSISSKPKVKFTHAHVFVSAIYVIYVYITGALRTVLISTFAKCDYQLCFAVTKLLQGHKPNLTDIDNYGHELEYQASQMP